MHDVVPLPKRRWKYITFWWVAVYKPGSVQRIHKSA